MRLTASAAQRYLLFEQKALDEVLAPQVTSRVVQFGQVGGEVTLEPPNECKRMDRNKTRVIAPNW